MRPCVPQSVFTHLPTESPPTLEVALRVVHLVHGDLMCGTRYQTVINQATEKESSFGIEKRTVTFRSIAIRELETTLFKANNSTRIVELN